VNKPLPASRFGERYKDQHDQIFSIRKQETMEDLQKWIRIAKEKGKRVYLEPEFAERLLAIWQDAQASS